MRFSGRLLIAVVASLVGLAELAIAPVLARAADEPETLPYNADCAGQPTARALQAAVDASTPVTLDLLVVLDRVRDPALAGDLVARVARAYRPLRIRIAPQVRHLDFTGNDAVRLLLQARERVPDAPRFDAVLVLTGVDLQGQGNRALAGSAYCIGGVRYRKARKAFAVAEVEYGKRDVPWATIDGQRNRSALVAAHELGHLLGAVHEEGNCAEAAGPEDVQPRHWGAPARSWINCSSGQTCDSAASRPE